MNSHSQQMPQTKFSFFVIIWTWLFISLLVYAFVVYSTVGPFVLDFSVVLTQPLLILALAVFVLSFFITKVIKHVPAKTKEEALRQSFLPFIIRLVLLEAVVIIGMFLSFQENLNLLIPFLVLSLVGFILAFPVESRLTQGARRRL